MAQRKLKFRAAVTSDFWDDKPAGTTLVSVNSFTLGQLWEREVELEFADGGSLPFGDIDWTSDKVEYLQFTGLKDKNGVEIYEGDILCPNDDRRFTEKIWFDDKAAMFCFGDLSLFEFLQVTDDREVIGNIYENPDLLKADGEHDAISSD